MKKKFSRKWIGSKSRRKQRKYRANAPLHLKSKMISANLAKSLREKHGRRSVPLRKGDNVKVLKGEFKGKTGKISLVFRNRMKVAIEGLQKTKKDGTKVNVIFDPSNLQIQELSLEDKYRIKSLKKEEGSEKEKKGEKKSEKEGKKIKEKEKEVK